MLAAQKQIKQWIEKQAAPTPAPGDLVRRFTPGEFAEIYRSLPDDYWN